MSASNTRLLLMVLCLGAAACGGAASQASGKSKPVAGGASAAAADPCSDYAERLCEEVGPQTESCRAVLGVVTLLSPRACEVAIADYATTRARVAELRKVCEQVAEAICAEFGAESEGCRAIRQNLPDIPPGHCHALQHQQDQLIAVLRQREALKGPLSDEQWKTLAAGQPASFGAPDARVVVVEFSDFQCPYCAQAAETVKRLKQQYAGRIRFVFRNFPLPFHPDALGAAQAALAAQDQGKFWEYHDLLFGNQGALGAGALVEYARRLGLDVDAFVAASKAETTAQRVAEDVRLGESVQVQGTPTMFIDKQRVDDPMDYDAVSHAIDEALAR